MLSDRETHLDVVRVAHAGVGLREADHRLELARGGRDAAVVRATVIANVAHVDVRLDERLARIVRENRVDVVPRPRDVRREVLDFLFGAASASVWVWGHRERDRKSVV